MTPADKAAFVGSAASRIRSTGDFRVIAALRGFSTRHRGATSNERVKAEQSYRNLYSVEKSRESADRGANGLAPELRFAYRVYESAKDVPFVGKQIAEELQEQLRRTGVQAKYDSTGARAESYSRLRLSQDSEADTELVLADAWDAAQANPELSALFDEVWGPDLNAYTRDDARTALSRNPEFAQTTIVQRIFDAQGGLIQDIDAVRDALREGVDQVVTQMSDVTDRLKSSERETKRVGLDIESIARGLREHAVARKRQEDNEALDAGLRGGAAILSALLPPAEGRKVTAVVNAVVETRKVLAAFEATTSAVDVSSLAMGLGAAALTGGMLTIGLGLAAAFADQGPSADELILQGIRALSEQIDAFQKECRERFDRIDATLAEIGTAMTKGFGEIAEALVDQRRLTREVQSSISVAIVRLNAIERRIMQSINILVDEETFSKLDECIDYEEVRGLSIPADLFYETETQIAISYLRVSTQPPFSGDWNSQLSPQEAITAVFLDDNYSAQINSVLALAQAVAGYSFPKRLSNPGRWVTCASLYEQLALAGPKAFTEQQPDRLLALIQHGEALATLPTTFQAEPDKLVALLEFLSRSYLEAVDELADEIASIRQIAARAAGAKALPLSNSWESDILSELNRVESSPGTLVPPDGSGVESRIPEPHRFTDIVARLIEKPIVGTANPSLRARLLFDVVVRNDLWPNRGVFEPYPNPEGTQLIGAASVWSAFLRQSPKVALAEMLGPGSPTPRFSFAFKPTRVLEVQWHHQIWSEPVVNVYLLYDEQGENVRAVAGLQGWGTEGVSRSAFGGEANVGLNRELTISDFTGVISSRIHWRPVGGEAAQGVIWQPYQNDELEHRFDQLAVAVYGALIIANDDQGSSFNQLLQKVNAFVQAIRSVSIYAFSSEALDRDEFRASLFADLAGDPQVRLRSIIQSDTFRGPLSAEATRLSQEQGWDANPSLKEAWLKEHDDREHTVALFGSTEIRSLLRQALTPAGISADLLNERNLLSDLSRLARDAVGRFMQAAAGEMSIDSTGQMSAAANTLDRLRALKASHEQRLGGDPATGALQ